MRASIHLYQPRTRMHYKALGNGTNIEASLTQTLATVYVAGIAFQMLSGLFAFGPTAREAGDFVITCPFHDQ
jgi:hypothetical protein